MFGISFFSNKVAHHLFKMGYTPQDIHFKREFKLISDGLKANGYSAEEAARLWSGFLQRDKVSITEMRENSGLYGVLLLNIRDDA